MTTDYEEGVRWISLYGGPLDGRQVKQPLKPEPSIELSVEDGTATYQLEQYILGGGFGKIIYTYRYES